MDVYVLYLDNCKKKLSNQRLSTAFSLFLVFFLQTTQAGRWKCMGKTPSSQRIGYGVRNDRKSTRGQGFVFKKLFKKPCSSQEETDSGKTTFKSIKASPVTLSISTMQPYMDFTWKKTEKRPAMPRQTPSNLPLAFCLLLVHVRFSRLAKYRFLRFSFSIKSIILAIAIPLTEWSSTRPVTPPSLTTERSSPSDEPADFLFSA